MTSAEVIPLRSTVFLVADAEGSTGHVELYGAFTSHLQALECAGKLARPRIHAMEVAGSAERYVTKLRQKGFKCVPL